jgi:hypothetical protein
MSEIKKWLRDYWSVALITLAALIALVSFLWFRLVSIPNGYSNGEWLIHNNLAAKKYTFLYLWHHVAFAPYYIALMIPQYINRYGLFSIRSIGALFGIISTAIFFYIIWRWWGTLIAVLATLMFTTSFWFVQTSRNAGPIILYILAGLIIINLGFVVRDKKNHDTKTLLSALLALVLLYIPGMIWFVVAACLLQRKFIVTEFKRIPIQVKFIIPIAGLIFLLPLIHASYNNIATLRTLLGLPLVFSLHNFIRNFYQWPLIIFIRNPVISSYSIGHLPILSLFSDAMFFLGAYWIWLKRSLDRVYLLGATILLSWILYALGGPVSIYLALPFIMCIAATGIAFILGEWFIVFPRNPVARAVGITVISLAVFTVCLYHIDLYFVAWPKTTTTIALYSTHK